MERVGGRIWPGSGDVPGVPGAAKPAVGAPSTGAAQTRVVQTGAAQTSVSHETNTFADHLSDVLTAAREAEAAGAGRPVRAAGAALPAAPAGQPAVRRDRTGARAEQLARVRALGDAGWAEVDIARATGLGRGEVGLILRLGR